MQPFYIILFYSIAVICAGGCYCDTWNSLGKFVVAMAAMPLSAVTKLCILHRISWTEHDNTEYSLQLTVIILYAVAKVSFWAEANHSKLYWSGDHKHSHNNAHSLLK